MTLVKMEKTATVQNVEDYLTEIGTVDVRGLVKTPSGYSPLIITDKNTEYVIEGASSDIVIYAIAKHIKTCFGKLYNYLLSTDTNREAYKSGYFFMETIYHIAKSSTVDLKMFKDGRADSFAWCLIIPDNATHEDIAKQIHKHFAAIGGFTHSTNGGSVNVFFFRKNQRSGINSGEDYRHCVSYMLNSNAFRGFTHPATYGEYKTFLKKNTTWDNEYIERELAEVEAIDDDKRYPLKNTRPDGTMLMIGTAFDGLARLIGYTHDQQVSICTYAVRERYYTVRRNLIKHSSRRCAEKVKV